MRLAADVPTPQSLRVAEGEVKLPFTHPQDWTWHSTTLQEYFLNEVDITQLLKDHPRDNNNKNRTDAANEKKV